MQKIDWKNLFILIFPIILVLPLPLIVSAIALALALLNLVILSIIEGGKKKFLVTPFFLLCATAFFLDLLTGLLRGEPLSGALFRETRLSLILIPLVFAFSIRQLNSLKRPILLSFLIGTLLYIFYAYAYLIYFYNFRSHRSFELNQYLKYDLYNYLPFAYHHTYLGFYFCFSILIVLFYAKKAIGTKYVLPLALFIFMNQLFMGSKLTVFLSGFAILFYVLRKQFSKTKKTVSNVVASVVLLTATPIVLLLLLQRQGLLQTIGNSIERRLDIWRCALDLIQQKVLVGWGKIVGSEQLEQCVPHSVYGTHNQFLEEFQYYGLFGAWIFLFFYILWLKSKADLLFKSFIILIFIVSLIESVFSLQRGVLFVMFFSSLFYFLAYFNESTHKTATNA